MKPEQDRDTGAGAADVAGEIDHDLAQAAAGGVPRNPPTISQPIPLDTPIVRGDQRIDSLQVRRPKSGELRGLGLLALAQMEVDALHVVLPRICVPFITKAEAMALDPADLFALGAEVAGFLPQKADRAAYQGS